MQILTLIFSENTPEISVAILTTELKTIEIALNDSEIFNVKHPFPLQAEDRRNLQLLGVMYRFVHIWILGFQLTLKRVVVFTTAQKVSKYGVFSGPFFPVFRLNTKIYSVNLRIQPIYGKIQTRKNFVFAHFSHSVLLKKNLALRLCFA